MSRDKPNIPTIEQLCLWQKRFPRRIEVTTSNDGKKTLFHSCERYEDGDCDTTHLRGAQPIAPPELIVINGDWRHIGNIPIQTDRYGGIESNPRFSDRPFSFTFCKPIGFAQIYELTQEEFEFLLGRDYMRRPNNYKGNLLDNILALRAAEKIFCEDKKNEFANAYVLGDSVDFRDSRQMIEGYQHTESRQVVPVQYYQIDPRDQRMLALPEERVRLIMHDIKNERKNQK